MSEGLPERVDAVRLAARDARIRSVTPVGVMTRLADLLVDATGRVESNLRFTQDTGRNLIEGDARATVQMTCQRCLEPMPVALETAFRLVVVAADDADLPEYLDPVLGTAGEVSPLALVEDELLLVLPSIVLHDEGVCRPPVDVPAATTERANPFAVLRELKKQE